LAGANCSLQKKIKAVLELKTINSYYGKAHILSDLSFSINKGEVVSLLGRNGAGKTTTMKSIMQLVKAHSGSITFQGNKLTSLAPYQVARLGLGYVPEERRIFTDLTIIENLQVGRQPAREGVFEWTTESLFELFPNLRERRGNRGRELSGGEQQMLSIARTLMGNPKLLLLDEPSEGIAPIIVEQMAETILKLKAEGLSVLLSEQNLHFARIVSDRAVIIENGRIKYDGSFTDLDAQPEIRDAYLSV
jgi:branched-chain amino acid transport system ATP-binding protein